MILKYEDFKLNEYLDQNTMYLYKYLKNGSDEDDISIEIAHSNMNWYVDFFNSHTGDEILEEWFTEDELDKINQILDNVDEDDNYDDCYSIYEIILKSKNTDKVLIDVGEYIKPYLDESDLPSTSYFGSPSIVKKQWLVHLTDNASDIWNNGFTHGTDDMTKLGLTTYMTHDSKHYGGYNFAFTLYDFDKYGTNGDHAHNFRYGDEAILFKCQGVSAWHYGDEEQQTIFWGESAEDIIWMEYGDSDNDEYGDVWFIESRITGKRLVEREDVVGLSEWVDKHYDQYRKHLKNKKKDGKSK